MTEDRSLPPSASSDSEDRLPADPRTDEAAASPDSAAASELMESASLDSAPMPLEWLRFDLKAMFALMAICSAQFAVISYLGPVTGLVLGLVVCHAILAVVVGWAIIAGRRTSGARMQMLDRIAIRTVVATAVLFVAMMITGGAWTAYQEISNYRRQSQLENDLGFSTTNQWVVTRGHYHEAPVIQRVAPGGPFDQAGVKKGDVLLIESTTADFYQILEENRGKVVSVNIAIGGEYTDLDKCVKMSISVQAPAH